MSKIEDIFTAKRAINDLKKICNHYETCKDCPINVTGMCSSDSWVMEWNPNAMFTEKR